MSSDEIHFDDETIKNFFKEVMPIAELSVNKHTLDILTNMSVITMLTGQLIISMTNHNREEVVATIHSLHAAFSHSPHCYAAMDGVLNELWEELFHEDYIDHLFGEPDDNG